MYDYYFWHFSSYLFSDKTIMFHIKLYLTACKPYITSDILCWYFFFLFGRMSDMGNNVGAQRKK